MPPRRTTPPAPARAPPPHRARKVTRPRRTRRFPCNLNAFYHFIKTGQGDHPEALSVRASASLPPTRPTFRHAPPILTLFPWSDAPPPLTPSSRAGSRDRHRGPRPLRERRAHRRRQVLREARVRPRAAPAPGCPAGAGGCARDARIDHVPPPFPRAPPTHPPTAPTRARRGLLGPHAALCAVESLYSRAKLSLLEGRYSAGKENAPVSLPIYGPDGALVLNNMGLAPARARPARFPWPPRGAAGGPGADGGRVARTSPGARGRRRARVLRAAGERCLLRFQISFDLLQTSVMDVCVLGAPPESAPCAVRRVPCSVFSVALPRCRPCSSHPALARRCRDTAPPQMASRPRERDARGRRGVRGGRWPALVRLGPERGPGPDRQGLPAPRVLPRALAPLRPNKFFHPPH